jgi:hypothetical protein
MEMFRMPRMYVRLPWWMWLLFGVIILAGYAIAAIIMLVLLLVKGIVFVLVVMPHRLIVHGRENVNNNRIERAKDRMQNYMDGR